MRINFTQKCGRSSDEATSLHLKFIYQMNRIFGLHIHLTESVELIDLKMLAGHCKEKNAGWRYEFQVLLSLKLPVIRK